MTSIVDAVVSTVTERINALPPAHKIIVGVSGPQGSGKTTVTQLAAKQLTETGGIPTLALSLDDFYLPYKDLQNIAARGNPLLKHRGLPGTHDTQLLAQFCSSFVQEGTSEPLTVPMYDKSLHQGAGDRARFIDVPPATRVVLLEGWMLGFQPVGQTEIARKADSVTNETVKPSEADLLEIDTNLRNYLPVWDSVHMWVRLIPESIDYVYIWRVAQEHDLIRDRGSGMSDSQVRAFVDQYMPCYKLYLATLSRLHDSLRFSINKDHQARRIN